MKEAQAIPEGSGSALPPKKKKGRPKAHIDLAKAERLAAQGLTQEEIAYCLGISPSTLYEHKIEYSEFSEALRRGKAKGVAEISNVVYNTALKGNLNAALFYLRAKSGWRDKGIFSPEVIKDLIEVDGTQMLREFAAELLKLPKGALNLSGKYPHVEAQVFEAETVSKIPDTPTNSK